MTFIRQVTLCKFKPPEESKLKHETGPKYMPWRNLPQKRIILIILILKIA